MRLDKFLQLSRLIKQRSWAKAACDKGLLKVDGQRAKASKTVEEGQRIRIHYARKILEVEILEVPTGNVSKKRASELYEVTYEETIESEF